LFDQPFLPPHVTIQFAPDKIVFFSSSSELVESEMVKPIFEILDVPLQIGVGQYRTKQKKLGLAIWRLEITIGSFVGRVLG
jgi:hypothetical protein